MDYIFDMYLNSQVRKFKQAVMEEYWKFRRKPEYSTGFHCLEVTSKEFLLQKYFEKRVENYIRRYLVNGFLGRVLEARGNGIYPVLLPQNFNGLCSYSNMEFEQIVSYEFIMDSINSNKRIKVRYTDVTLEKALELSDNVDEIYVLSWDKFYIDTVEGKTVDLLQEGKLLIRGSINNFMMENGFSEEEYFKYITVLSDIVTEVQELLGVKTISKLTPAELFRYRFEVESNIVEFVNKYHIYQKCEEKIKENGLELIQNFNWAYQIIDDDNRKKYPELEVKTKEMLMSGALDVFIKKRYYLALIGRSDYARSFITSEYLYKQFKCDEQFDYTAIISGYLKCVEQILYRISLSALDKKVKIKSSGKKWRMDLDFRIKLSLRLQIWRMVCVIRQWEHCRI